MRIIMPLEEGNVYHIYNRGINSESIFKEKRNYYYFLKKYEEYCSGILETYAYALLENHFHLMIKVKQNESLNTSRQLSHFFNCYAQSINKAYNRHGKLFEEPFRRKLVDHENYFTSLIYYIHFNPQHHGFVNDFRDWEFTSWHSLLNAENNFLAKNIVFEWFGGAQQFFNAHMGNMQFIKTDHLIIE